MQKARRGEHHAVLFRCEELVLVLAIANELFAASGAGKIFRIDLAVENDGFAASGASDLEAVVATAVAITVTIIAIAVTVIAIAIVILCVKLLFNCAEILIDLLNVIVQILKILVGFALCSCNIGNDVDKCADELALCGFLVEIKSFCKPLYIGCLFGKCHNNSPL